MLLAMKWRWWSNGGNRGDRACLVHQESSCCHHAEWGLVWHCVQMHGIARVEGRRRASLTKKPLVVISHLASPSLPREQRRVLLTKKPHCVTSWIFPSYPQASGTIDNVLKNLLPHFSRKAYCNYLLKITQIPLNVLFNIKYITASHSETLTQCNCAPLWRKRNGFQFTAANLHSTAATADNNGLATIAIWPFSSPSSSKTTAAAVSFPPTDEACECLKCLPSPTGPTKCLPRGLTRVTGHPQPQAFLRRVPLPSFF